MKWTVLNWRWWIGCPILCFVVLPLGIVLALIKVLGDIVEILVEVGENAEWSLGQKVLKLRDWMYSKERDDE